MIYLVLFILSFAVAGVLLSNNIIAKKCKKNEMKSMMYVNLIGIFVLFFFELIMRGILGSGGASYAERIDIGGPSRGASDKVPYAINMIEVTIALFGVILFILNMIKTSNCEKINWKWLEVINWTFVFIFSAIGLYGLYMFIRRIRGGTNIF
jgi:hypothetical protein